MAESSKGVAAKNANESVVFTESYEGPIPHPSIIKGYEDVLPGAADRILKMAEGQSLHRRKLESRVVLFDVAQSYSGLILMFLIVSGALYGAYDLINKGKDVQAYGLFVTALATAFGPKVFRYIIERNRPKKNEN
jgi:uncharacterized membrane protein